MTAGANTLGAPASRTERSQEDRTVRAFSPNGPSIFSDLVAAAAGWLGGKRPDKLSEQLGAIMGCDPKSVARYRAGLRTPGGEALENLLRNDEIGHRAQAYLIQRAAAELTPQQQDELWQALGWAALRHQVREKQSIGVI